MDRIMNHDIILLSYHTYHTYHIYHTSTQTPKSLLGRLIASSPVVTPLRSTGIRKKCTLETFLDRLLLLLVSRLFDLLDSLARSSFV